MGTPHAAVPSLERLLDDGHEVAAVYTQPDRPSGRGSKIVFSPVKQFAMDRGLPVMQPSKIRTAEALEELLSYTSDIAVVVAYGRILPETFLRAFPRGAINVHFSLLPKYRGAAPVNWAIVSGETTTGVTTMLMDSGLDTGDILLQREAKIGAKENSIELMERLSFVGADLLSETLESLDSVVPVPQNNENATYAPIMRKEDGAFNWSMTANEISRRVRGFQPFPTTYCYLHGKRLTVWSAGEDAAVSADERPGTILAAKGDELMVACGGSSVIRIDELQLEGKRRMKARDFLNGIAVRVGELLE